MLLALSATTLLCTVPAEAADINVSNPQYPFTPVGNIGWDPGMTHARAAHWAYDGAPEHSGNYGWYQYWSSCPDDSGGCSGIGVLDDQYHADFDIAGSLTPCHPNTGDAVTLPGADNAQYNSLPCPLYASWYGWFGTTTPKSYSGGINNYSWNRWNSPNIWAGLKEDKYRSASLNNLRLDRPLLSVTLTSYLSRTYVQDGKAPRGQGRINIGFTFIGANGQTYVIEMNFSNMRVNLNDHRQTAEFPGPAGAPMIPVSNPWRDDIWAEYIYGDGYTVPHTYVIGARNWGYNLVEGQTTKIFFDPWWVATTLLYPPGDCPKMLNNDGTQSTSYVDPGGYGVIPCGAQAAQFKLPREALFDANDQPAAYFIGFYSGVEMAGSAVYGNAGISGWTIQKRW